MTTPHDAWAHAYDAIYEGSFGSFYTNLTAETLACLGELAVPPAHIVDFGAGTGRLSIPLARQGYSVIAVEPSAAMLEQLRAKAEGAGLAMETHHQRMQDPL
jgi:2-polyprenyl-3-methyl-5-hydroxy-6-metoxy-1,4-benzoquinol methylase